MGCIYSALGIKTFLFDLASFTQNCNSFVIKEHK